MTLARRLMLGSLVVVMTLVIAVVLIAGARLRERSLIAIVGVSAT